MLNSDIIEEKYVEMLCSDPLCTQMMNSELCGGLYLYGIHTAFVSNRQMAMLLTVVSFNLACVNYG